MTVFRKLRQKIKEELGFDSGDYRRLYTGHWQKSAGAFTWAAYVYVDGENTCQCIGSCYSATELIKKNISLSTRNAWGDIEICPEVKK